ncbi:MAG: SDR family oxidoreductase [Candidatus Abyssubacteria bacterium]
MRMEGRRRALITGASSGIGEEMARILAKDGYQLMLVSRNGAKLARLAEEMESSSYFVCDLSKESEVERLVQAHPETDVLVNNAGFAAYGQYHVLGWERQRDMIMVNVVALSRLCHHYLKGMLERDCGKILNVASTAGQAPAPYFSTYVGTKAFVIQFSKSLALETQKTNVTVSCLLPGPTATEFWRSADMIEKVREAMVSYQSPREVAQFGIRLMNKGGVSGVPGWTNKLKGIVRHYLPDRIWGRLVTNHMTHESLYRDRD